MSESLRSMILGISGLYLIAILALILTLTRSVKNSDPSLLKRTVYLYLLCVGCQCLHFLEELLTGFYRRFPEFLGLVSWPMEFFVTLNVTFIALWVFATIGIQQKIRAVYFMAWFVALAGLVNVVAHPLLALATQGYFPGLITAPIVGFLGFELATKLWRLTDAT